MFELKRLTHFLTGQDMRLTGGVLVKKGKNSHITFDDKDKIEKILGCETYMDFAGQLRSTSKIILVKKDRQRVDVLQKQMSGLPIPRKDLVEVREKMRENKYGFTKDDLNKVNNFFN